MNYTPAMYTSVLRSLQKSSAVAEKFLSADFGKSVIVMSLFFASHITLAAAADKNDIFITSDCSFDCGCETFKTEGLSSKTKTKFLTPGLDVSATR